MELPHDEEALGGIVINPNSELGKELRKHEQHRTELVPRGTNPGNPYVYRPYPAMLYRAQRHPRTGKGSVVEVPPHPMHCKDDKDYERQCLETESFNRSNQRIVKDEFEAAIASGQGWCETPIAAMDRYEMDQIELGNLSAQAAYGVQKMSGKAKEEFAMAEASSEHHVVDVVGTSKKRRGRPKRLKAVTGQD